MKTLITKKIFGGLVAIFLFQSFVFSSHAKSNDDKSNIIVPEVLNSNVRKKPRSTIDATLVSQTRIKRYEKDDFKNVKIFIYVDGKFRGITRVNKESQVKYNFKRTVTSEQMIKLVIMKRKIKSATVRSLGKTYKEFIPQTTIETRFGNFNCDPIIPIKPEYRLVEYGMGARYASPGCSNFAF